VEGWKATMLRAAQPKLTGIPELCLGDGGVGGLFFVSRPLSKDCITSPRSYRSDPNYLSGGSRLSSSRDAHLSVRRVVSVSGHSHFSLMFSLVLLKTNTLIFTLFSHLFFTLIFARCFFIVVTKPRPSSLHCEARRPESGGCHLVIRP